MGTKFHAYGLGAEDGVRFTWHAQHSVDVRSSWTCVLCSICNEFVAMVRKHFRVGNSMCGVFMCATQAFSRGRCNDFVTFWTSVLCALSH